jgi:endo-1,4-beta-mannosidase
VERTNSISGRKYRDDATIFAWDLVNEPRCETWRVSVKTSAAQAQ